MKKSFSFAAPDFRRWIFFTLCLLFPATLLAQFNFVVPRAPDVRIISPANHSTFHAPIDLPLFAYAEPLLEESPELPGVHTVTNVEFYAGTQDLGPGFSLGAAALPNQQPVDNIVFYSPITRLGRIYCLTWTNAPVGQFILTAVSQTIGGMTRTSPPVNITVLPAITNASTLDVVSIVATDPIAIAGTNACIWRGETNAVPAWTNWTDNPTGLFTNWGPKNGLFTVRRFGDDSSSLTVTYQIGGTASNGVDYVALPGTVTFPAGVCYALIPIVPIDNVSPSLSKSVILSLYPSTDVVPDYQLGFPSRAEVLIREQWLRLPGILPDATFHMCAAGPDGAWFFVQRSPDFINWSNVCTNQAFQGCIDFVDPDASGNARGYYRAIPLSGPPAE